ncbi:MAG: GTPase ObgE [Candidatus Eisenbacteria bacterium]
MFIDEASILVRSGKGGDGCVSFRREKYVARGGPDGGDGGRGGDVVLEVDPHLRTLLPFRHEREFQAQNGQPGMGKQMFGRDGEDQVIAVPRGTLVEDEAGRVVADLVTAGQSVIVARGGKGGKGNVHFKSATRQVPKFATEGQPGEECTLKLTLKLLADVGLVGLPNVGKSTLMRRVSNATPRIGDYHFTTIRPNLGIVDLGGYRSVVMADLPGLIEGASEGRGLGHQFLRHVERTRILVFLIDAASARPQHDLDILLGELRAFRPALLERPRIICYSRADLVVGQDLPPLGGEDPLRISAHTGDGVDRLLHELGELFTKLELEEGPAPMLVDIEREERAQGGSATQRAMEDGIASTDGDTFFADLVDEEAFLGPFPWPRESRVRVEEASGVAETAMAADEFDASDDAADVDDTDDRAADDDLEGR